MSVIRIFYHSSLRKQQWLHTTPTPALFLTVKLKYPVVSVSANSTMVSNKSGKKKLQKDSASILDVPTKPVQASKSAGSVRSRTSRIIGLTVAPTSTPRTEVGVKRVLQMPIGHLPRRASQRTTLMPTRDQSVDGMLFVVAATRNTMPTPSTSKQPKQPTIHIIVCFTN